MGEIFCGVEQEKKVRITDLVIMPDHVYLLARVDPELSIHRLGRLMKGRSSRLLRKEFPWLRLRLPTLWTGSYIVATVEEI